MFEVQQTNMQDDSRYQRCVLENHVGAQVKFWVLVLNLNLPSFGGF